MQNTFQTESTLEWNNLEQEPPARDKLQQQLLW